MSFGTNAPQGFIDNKSKIGASYNTQDYLYDIESGYATALFKGDPVVRAGGYLTRATAGTGNPVCGVFLGVTYLDSTGELKFAPYWAANTPVKDTQPAKAYVIDDPYVVFTVQVGGGGLKAQRAHLGQNANFNFGTGGNTFSGTSGAFLDISTVGVQATKNCKILSITPGFSASETASTDDGVNALDKNYNNVNVIFNNHQFKGGTGTVGT